MHVVKFWIQEQVASTHIQTGLVVELLIGGVEPLNSLPSQRGFNDKVLKEKSIVTY